jgi:hypothetical protein
VDGAYPARPAIRWVCCISNADLEFVRFTARRGGVHGDKWFATLARVLLPPYAVDTRCVGHLALPLGCFFGLSLPGTRLIRSVPSPAAARCTSLPCVERSGVDGEISQLQGEVSMCVLLTHSTVMTRAAVGGVVQISPSNLLRIRAFLVSCTPPAAGVSWWIHGVSGVPLHRLRKRAALSPSRNCRFSWLGSRWRVEVVRAQRSGRWCVRRVWRMVTGRAHPSAASLSDLAAYKPTEL